MLAIGVTLLQMFTIFLALAVALPSRGASSLLPPLETDWRDSLRFRAFLAFKSLALSFSYSSCLLCLNFRMVFCTSSLCSRGTGFEKMGL